MLGQIDTDAVLHIANACMNTIQVIGLAYIAARYGRSRNHEK